MMRKWLLILLLGSFISPALFAQSGITGTWEGKFLSPELALGQPKLVVEIYDFKDSMYTGITHLYYEGNKYEHYKMIGWYDKKDSLLVFTEAETIAVDLGIFGNCLGTYKMSLQKKGNDLYQFGYWVSNIRGCSPTSTTWLKKIQEEPKIVPHEEKKKPEIKIPPVVKNKPVPGNLPADRQVKPTRGKEIIPDVVTTNTTPAEKDVVVKRTTPTVIPAKISQRTTDLQSLLEIPRADKDSIKVEVYDNGEIDGDSVSVFQENIAVVDKKMITAKPITFYISLDKKINPIAHLRLVAESLGSIPPCTALMIVTTKSKRYEVHLSSNFNKNATVELFLKE